MWGLSNSGLSVDLGSGAGLPGLVLACSWPESRWILMDSSTRRTAWLASAVERLGVSARVRVLCARAEVVGRGELRGSIHHVVARSFGAPAVTAECAAPLLRIGGSLVVAEPPT
ncbi:MAG: RsmG family class I SAM-dependent methyltransferase, partial [Acidimicrobiales bacterium]